MESMKPVKPSELARELKRLTTTMSSEQIAEKICKTVTWVNNHLNLLLLKQEYLDLVDNGEITVLNGIILSHLWLNEQSNFVERAKTLSPGKLTRLVQEHIKSRKRDPSI